MQHLKIHKFPFKNVIVLAIECKMYLKIQQKLHCLGCILKQAREPSWRKQGWIPRGTISWWKASLPLQEESWGFFWTFSFHFLSFNDRFIAKRKSRWPCDACVIHARFARNEIINLAARRFAPLFAPLFARKNNFAEIHISQGLDWAFPSLSHYGSWLQLVTFNYFPFHLDVK